MNLVKITDKHGFRILVNFDNVKHIYPDGEDIGIAYNDGSKQIVDGNYTVFLAQLPLFYFINLEEGTK